MAGPKRKRRRWPVAFLAVGLLGILSWQLWPTNNLIARSTRVADTKDWSGGERFNVSIGMHWLSNEDILFDRYEGSDKNQRVIYRRNVRTGQEKRLNGLTASLEDLGGETVDDQAVSPDGKWFLCSSRWEDCELAEVNGSRHYSYSLKDTDQYYVSDDTDCYRSFLWMPDSRHWLENLHLNDACHRLIMHDVEHPKQSTPLPIGKNAELYARIKQLLPGQQAIRTDSPSPDDLQSPPILTLQRFTFEPSPKPKKIEKITAPRNAREFEYKLSPKGDRIAWYITYETSEMSDTSLQKWLRRYLPSVLAPSGWKSEIWISRIDGTEMRMLGQMASAIMDSNGHGQILEDAEVWHLHDLQWLPNGKRLSYTYQNVLYIISAE